MISNNWPIFLPCDFLNKTGVLAFEQFESYKNAFMYNSKQTKPTVGVIALQNAKPCIYRESVCFSFLLPDTDWNCRTASEALLRQAYP